MSSTDLLPASVLRRKAVVYVRQSSQTQVQVNLESQRRQYDLVEEARHRGFQQVEVIDDGPGIPPDIAGSIFEPFVSGRENGTGLGLALVSKIISDHGGWIAVDSVPGRTVFRVSLPVAARGEGGGDAATG